MQKALALLFALLVAPAAAVSLRRVSDNADPAKPKDIKEKYEKLDKFLGVMFNMACTWKNGKDVFGLAAEKLKKGEVDGADGYAAYVKELQAKNVKGLQKACGFIIGDDKKECRDGCAARWNQVAEKRDNCDEKCVELYANFERSCNSKADNLVKVYAQKSAQAAGQKQCYEGHCKEFPQVWMKAEKADMEKEVKSTCDKRCTEKAVKAGCQRKWAVEVDLVTAKVASKCAEESGVKDCFDGKQKDASADYDKCQTDTKKDCGTAYDECKKKSNADKNFKDAEAFCTDRKKMCQGQADKKCLKENKQDLAKAEGDCKAEAGEANTKCQDDTLEKMEKAAEKKCVDERKPTCKADCGKKCQITKMNDCLKAQQTKDDPGKLFCEDFWHMLHTSSETNPETGDPTPA